MDFLYAAQRQWIHGIQGALRGTWSDAFFIGWNFVDTAYFLFFLVPFLWIFSDKRLGKKVFYAALLSSLANGWLKEIFQVIRPFHLDPSLHVLAVKGWSFPSGAAQTAIWLPGLCALQSKQLRSWLWAGLFAALLSFSRVYLGVHYPTDLMGGWIVGASILWLLADQGGYLRLERLFLSLKMVEKGVLSLLFAGALCSHPNGQGAMFASLFLGVQWGTCFPPLKRGGKAWDGFRALALHGGAALCLWRALELSSYLTAPPHLAAVVLCFVCGLWLSWGGEQAFFLLGNRLGGKETHGKRVPMVKRSRSEERGLASLRPEDRNVYSVGISTSGNGEKQMLLQNPHCRLVATTLDCLGAKKLREEFKSEGFEERIEVKVEDISQPLPYSEESFDFIYARLVLHQS